MVRSRSGPLIVLLVIAALVTAGCLLPGDPQAGDPDTTSDPSPTPRPGATGSLEGRFTYATMDEYVRAVVPYITSYLQDTWPRMPLPQVVYVPEGQVGREGCTDANGQPAQFSSQSYEYCPADATIYVGQDMLWAFYTETGDAGPAVGLAHEFGHHIQVELGVAAERMSSVRVENQADCISGAWTRYTDRVLGALEYPDDIQDIEALFPLIGSAEDPGRDHGTPAERARSFQSGFDSGVQACGL